MPRIDVYKRQELEYELGMVEPDLIFNDGIDYGYRAQLEALYGARLRPMDAWTAAPEAEMVNRIDHEGLLMLMFTSGTTGRRPRRNSWGDPWRQNLSLIHI